MATSTLGESIPSNTSHAVSVSLPTWKSNVGYEEGADWVISKMETGYPRFFIHKRIAAFALDIVQKYGRAGEQAMLFPSSRIAKRCTEFMLGRDSTIKESQIRIIDLALDPRSAVSESLRKISPSISAVLFPKEKFSVAKQYWQHSGDGISSRRAEFCHPLFSEGLLVERKLLKPLPNGQERLSKGPKRYQRGSSGDIRFGKESEDAQEGPGGTDHISATVNAETRESTQFVEERYGRNLDISQVDNAKSAIRRRIAGSLTTDVDLARPLSAKMDASSRGVAGLSESDVYLYPCGMNAIFNAHQMMLHARGPKKSILFGFPYVDTLKILEKFGPGCIFYGNGSSDDLDDLERRLKSGEKYLALFCEFPGNPLLSSPDLQRIRELANTYDFGVVIDETIGNFINVHVLPYADIVVSSLTKVFAGECNVMGGSGILNPSGRYYPILSDIAATHYEDTYWCEDALFMERNSRDFVSRIARINHNAEIICDVLRASPVVKDLFYPKYVPSRRFYDACRTPDGGYGGLLSVTFHQKGQAITFFDHIETAKGPSLGTNFTLTSPYVILAHYAELDWAQTFGVDPDLIRISVGLEETEKLKSIFLEALGAAEASITDVS